MREQKEQEKQNELLRVVAEQNHERLIEYDVKEDRAVVYAIENDRFEVLFDIEDYVKKNHYGSVFIDPEDKKVFRRAMHACLQKEGTVTVDVRYCEKENQPEWYRFYLVSIAMEKQTVWWGVFAVCSRRKPSRNACGAGQRLMY